mgnify:CR=1 FL=1
MVRTGIPTGDGEVITVTDAEDDDDDTVDAGTVSPWDDDESDTANPGGGYIPGAPDEDDESDDEPVNTVDGPRTTVDIDPHYNDDDESGDAEVIDERYGTDESGQTPPLATTEEEASSDQYGEELGGDPVGEVTNPATGETVSETVEREQERANEAANNARNTATEVNDRVDWSMVASFIGIFGTLFTLIRYLWGE